MSPNPAHRPAEMLPPPHSVPWKPVLIFAAIAYALLALSAAPFWFLPGGIAHPLYSWVLSAGMLAPAIATVIVVNLVTRGSWRDEVGLRFRGRWKRLALWIPLAVLVMLAINAASAVIMVLRGVPGDLTGSTWAHATTIAMADAGAEMPVPVAVTVVLALTAVNLLVSVIPALGEEIGWRGWLWRQLKPLGFTGAIVVGALIWSLWHLPITLIGHNYPGAPRPLAIGMFIIACVALHFLFGAITERARGNPLPAAFAHSTLNSTVGLAVSIVATQGTLEQMNWFIDTPLGVIGIALTVFAAYLIMPRGARGTFGPQPHGPQTPDAL